MNALKKLRDRVTVVNLGENSDDEDEAMPSTGLPISRLIHIRSWTFSTLRYFLFLTLFTIVVFGSRPGEAGYYMTDQLEDLFLREEFPSSSSHILKTFWDVATKEEMFQYLEGPFTQGLFPEFDYAGNPVPPELRRAIYGYDYLVGLVRIRQVRIRKDTCSVADKFKRIIEHCYDSWRASRESKDPFGPAGNEWVWEADRQTVFGGVNGRLHLYPDDGFVIDMAKDKTNATAQLAYLKDNGFVDLQTRLIAIEFSVYNANLNLFCVIRIAFELPDAGGVVPFVHFRTVKLLRYLSSMDYFVLVCELCLCALIFMYIVEEFIEVFQACCGKTHNQPGGRGWRAYFIDDMWNYLDILNLSLFLVVVIFRIIMTITLEQLFDSGNFITGESYLNLQGIALMATQEININAFNMLLCWIKTLKYLNHFDRIQQLSATLTRAAADTLLFLVIFLVVFLGYAQAGYMMFSADVKGFRTLPRAMEALLLSILGSFDYSELERTNRYLAPLYFFSYQLLVFFVLLNMFIAIVNNAYDSVRESAARRDAELRVEQLLSGKVQRLSPWAQLKRAALIMKDAMLVKRYRKRARLIEEIRSGKGDVNMDGLITRDEAINELDLSESDADDAFDRYDRNHDNALDEDEIEDWIDDLREEKEILESALSAFMELEQNLAETGKKMTKQQQEEREQIALRLEDYKKRVARMGHAGDPALRQLEIRQNTDGAPVIDPALLRAAASTAVHGSASSESHQAIITFLESINAKLTTMNNRLRRLEDSSRQSAKTSIRSSAHIGAGGHHSVGHGSSARNSPAGVGHGPASFARRTPAAHPSSRPSSHHTSSADLASARDASTFDLPNLVNSHGHSHGR